MFKYKSQKQLSIFDFQTGFESKLNSGNRWVKMAQMLDWDKLVAVYAKTLSSNMGAGSIDARIIMGALIIKHVEKKDDRGTIEVIRENPYMQYFLGLDHFTDKPVFDPSLFVTIRKRLGNEIFDEMNRIIISGALGVEEQPSGNKDIPDPKDQASGKEGSNGNDDRVCTGSPVNIPNKGKLQLDATVCDAYIKYPTDLNLLNESREKAEELLDKLSKALKIKPLRTYKRVARKEYLNVAKKKNKSREVIRKAIRKQLGYLRRDIGYINNILEKDSFRIRLFNKKENSILIPSKNSTDNRKRCTIAELTAFRGA